MKKETICLCAVAGWICLSMTTGCAFGDRKIALAYKPTVVKEASTDSASNPVSVAIVKFQDARPARSKPWEVGEVRNGYGMKTASVVAPDQDVGAWVANALASELEKAGFTIKKYNDAAPPESVVVISGAANELYIKAFMTLQGKLRVMITVTKSKVPVLNKEYVGQASSMNWAAASGEYEKVATATMADLMKRAVPDVIQAIR